MLLKKHALEKGWVKSSASWDYTVCVFVRWIKTVDDGSMQIIESEDPSIIVTLSAEKYDAMIAALEARPEDGSIPKELSSLNISPESWQAFLIGVSRKEFCRTRLVELSNTTVV